MNRGSFVHRMWFCSQDRGSVPLREKEGRDAMAVGCCRIGRTGQGIVHVRSQLMSADENNIMLHRVGSKMMNTHLS